MGIWRSRYAHRADKSSRPLAESVEKSRKVRRGLSLEPLEERVLMVIDAGPDLEQVLTGDGAPLVAGARLYYADEHCSYSHVCQARRPREHRVARKPFRRSGPSPAR